MRTMREPVRLVEQRFDGVQVVEVTLRVEVDPAWFGYGVPVRALAEEIVSTIDHGAGLAVTEESRAEVTA